MSAETSLSTTDVQTRLRGGVVERPQVSKTAKAAMWLFARAGAVASVVLYWGARGSADGQQAVLVFLTICWTVVAVSFVWSLDGFFRAVRTRFTTR